MIRYKNREEVELIRESALLVSKTLGLMAELIEPGIKTIFLDRKADEFIRDHGGVPGFYKKYDFPEHIITSVNEQVVHGIPGEYVLHEGDIISVDIGVLMNGYYGDHAYTFPVGEISTEKEHLLRVTKECLDKAILMARLNNRIGDIGFAVQTHAEKHGYGVVRELVGHGLGKNLHEKPDVPNYGKRGRGQKLKEGLVIAIEPMINMGSKKVNQLSDGWTIVTQDRKPSAHFEHDVAIIDGQTEVLSTFSYVEEALAKKGALVV